MLGCFACSPRQLCLTAHSCSFEEFATAPAVSEDVVALGRRRAARWLPAITNAGSVGFPADGFAVETITVPYANLWEAVFFCAAVRQPYGAGGPASRLSGMSRPLWRLRRTMAWASFFENLPL